MNYKSFSSSSLFEMKKQAGLERSSETIWTSIITFTNCLKNSSEDLQNNINIVSKVKDIIFVLPEIYSKENIKSCIKMSSEMFIVYYRLLQTEYIISLFEEYGNSLSKDNEMNDNRYTREEDELKKALKEFIKYLEKRKVSMETDLEIIQQLINKVQLHIKKNQQNNEEFNVTSLKLEYYIHTSTIEANIWNRQLQHANNLIAKCLQSIETMEKAGESTFGLNFNSRGLGSFLLFSLIDKTAALISSAIIGTTTLLGMHYEQKNRNWKIEKIGDIIQRISILKLTFINILQKYESQITTFNNYYETCYEIQPN